MLSIYILKNISLEIGQSQKKKYSMVTLMGVPRIVELIQKVG